MSETRHRLVGTGSIWGCTCGWTPKLGEAIWRAFDRHLASTASTDEERP